MYVGWLSQKERQLRIMGELCYYPGYVAAVFYYTGADAVMTNNYAIQALSKNDLAQATEVCTGQAQVDTFN